MLKETTSFNQWEQSKKAAAKKNTKSRLSGLDIEVADNGFVVNARFKTEPKKGDPYPYVEPLRKVFADAAAVGDFVTKCLGGGKAPTGTGSKVAAEPDGDAAGE